MDLPDTKELAKLVKFLRKEGVSELKSGEFAISLSPQSLFPTKPGKQDGGSEDVRVEGAFTADDVINWSSAGIPFSDQSGAQ